MTGTITWLKIDDAPIQMWLLVCRPSDTPNYVKKEVGVTHIVDTCYWCNHHEKLGSIYGMGYTHFAFINLPEVPE